MSRKKKNAADTIINDSTIDDATALATHETQTDETIVDVSAEALEAQTDPEAPVDAAPFDEAQLLELARNEGLIDAGATEEALLEEDVEIDMPESDQAAIMASIETILFMSDKPIGLSRLRQIIGTETKLAVYRRLMTKLRADFAKDHRGVEIAEVSVGFQLRTKPHMGAVLRKMVKTQPMKLSGTNLEVLAIVAYKQPVTKDDIDQIRGVDSGYVLRNLMEKRLVKISGRSDLPGRPMLYGTSHEFLELFNLKDSSSLPPLHEVEAMVAASEVGAEEKMQEALSDFGQMVATSDKILFDDSKLDDELEAIRAEIASIPTSTSFIDEQKAKEKMAAKLADLAQQGLTLDAEGNIVPIGAIASTSVLSDADLAIQIVPQVATQGIEAPMQAMSAHVPSADLESQAGQAQAERHAEMIEQAVAESEVALVNAEALADAVNEAMAEQERVDESREESLPS